MNTTNNIIGFCAICQTTHLSEEGFEKDRSCMNCREKAVYSLAEASDIINDYHQLKKDYANLKESLNMGAYD